MLCSLSMPAEYDVMAAHSPPVFSHSPPRYYSRSSHHAPPQRSASLPLMNRGHSGLTLGMGMAMVAVAVDRVDRNANGDSPPRPILVTSASSGDLVDAEDCAINSEPTSPTKLKKKVVFADDKGLQLEHVRMMTEPSSAPPRWSMQFLAQVTRGVTAEAAPEPWEMKFAQPASDYVAFRSRLDTCNVSLENVIVREAEQLLLGTVKVRNLAFHKEVLIRSSCDEWATHEDAYCTFVNSSVPSSVTVLYDTFSFRIPLPPRSRRLEFCVCFRAENVEYWDNNGGGNYALVKKISAGEVDAISEKIAELDLRRSSQPILIPSAMPMSKYDDALHAKMESWSEFASWNHLNNESPYW